MPTTIARAEVLGLVLLVGCGGDRFAQPPLAVVAPAGSQHHHQDGDAVHLHLPADKIWLMPGVGREP